MTTYKCGKFTVTMLHYGKKQVFCRGEDGDEYLVDREFFDGNYVEKNSFTKEQFEAMVEKAVNTTRLPPFINT